MDLSKVFDSLNHELLIAKLKCYGLDQYAVDFSRNYQCCKYPWGLEKKFSPCTTGIYTGSFVVQHIFKWYLFLFKINFYASFGNCKQ